MGYLQVLGAVSIWAFFNGILVKGIKTSGVSVGMWTALVGVLIFFGLHTNSVSLFYDLNQRQIFFLVLLGLAAGLNNACFYTALKISIPNAALFHYLAPLWVIGWGKIFPIFYQPMSSMGILAALIGFLGMIFVAMPNWKEGNKKLLFLGLGSALFYSLEIVLSGYLSKELGAKPEISSLFKLTFQAIVMLISAIVLQETLAVENKTEGRKIIAGGILLYISFVLYFSGSATVSDLHRGIIGYIDRIGAIVLGAIVFKEKITKNIIIGGALILGAGLLLIF